MLAPYFSTVTRTDLVEIADRLYFGTPEPLREPLLGAFLALSQMKFASMDEIQKVILEKVGRTMKELFDDLAKSDIGIALIEKGITKGKREGKAQGKAEGKAEGKIEAVRRQWKKKFGKPSLDLEAALKKATNTMLDHVLDEMVDAEYTLAQARKDLGL